MYRPTQPDRDQLFQHITEALNQMPELMRRVFILKHYREVCAEDIASRIDLRKEEVVFLLKSAEDLLYKKLQNAFRLPSSTSRARTRNS